MTTGSRSAPPRGRGRPRQITRERIVDAGIQLTLPALTVRGVADALGVSTVALHHHIDGVEGLRRLVAEEILHRRVIPPLGGTDLVDDLLTLSCDLRRFVHEHPGIAGYLARIDGSSVEGLAHIDAEHTAYAVAYRLSPTRASWLVSTVAEHAIALAELVYTRSGRPRRSRELIAERTDLTTLPKVQIRRSDHDDDWFFRWSMRATIVGTIALIDELP